MAKTISYNKAVEKIAMIGDTLKIDGFKQSTILATLFNVDKEKTMDDLANYRRINWGL